MLDVVSDDGCLDAGLGPTYPRDADGSIIPHSRCRPIGQQARHVSLNGIAYRSATLRTAEGQELAWFDRAGKLLAPSGPSRRYSS